MRYFMTASVAFLVFHVLLRNKMAGRKIQADFPKWVDYRRELLYSLCSISIFAVMAVAIFTIFRPYTQLYKDIVTHGMGYYFLSMGMILLLSDTYFYWMHRTIHHPQLYKTIHLVHHKSTNPSA